MIGPQQEATLAGVARLLSAPTEHGPGLAAHRAHFGPLPAPGEAGLIDPVTRSGLRGRGGAGFPTGRKIAAVAAAGGRPVVVANGCAGEPVSGKDHVLLELAPHLVLDGALAVATSLGADEVLLCVHRGDPIAPSLRVAVAERGEEGRAARLVEIPGRYAASEESALVNFINTGTARPTAKPPRPYERGVGGRPTMIANVETLAHVALVARYGADWFRAVGTADSPGTTLVTVGGAVAYPGVLEVALGTTLGEILELAGGRTGPVGALLVGGLGGGWLPAEPGAAVRLDHADLRKAGAALGVGTVLAMPAGVCGVTETARIASYLAAESARQCGPCMFGLPAVAADLWSLSGAAGDPMTIMRRLRRRLGLLPGRGACGHPDGFARFVRGALDTFADDFRGHAHGRPCPGDGRAWLRLPASGDSTPAGWR
ncbi:NADH-ubiquinone oxidoreductase-F iron-sulfur binding region domain-containing protein [Actinoplanes subtropicus]|uniref:NADH-ubiquinone oxidoreductase-F iron-sulfur binding region domain-containing protein n=1 Tax=Actinoplanes subtropicus TaxID=543632 RepID=UPI00068E22F0|nr:NADH-ubiquinone oxidoreductase-F iron-sulfur binding region domain-containing protein [Actinoplanes subtropicus]